MTYTYKDAKAKREKLKKENLEQRAMILERRRKKAWEGLEWCWRLIHEDGFMAWYESTTGKCWLKSWSNDPERCEDKILDVYNLIKPPKLEQLILINEELSWKDVPPSRRRYLRVIRATPTWACRKKIKFVYETRDAANELLHELAPFHVDHIIPIQGKKVSGLHVETNLRIITGKLKVSASSSWEVNNAICDFWFSGLLASSIK